MGSERWLAVVVGCRGVQVTSGCDPRNGWPVWHNPGWWENAACTSCMAIWVGEGNRVRWEAWFLGKRWKNRSFHIRLDIRRFNVRVVGCAGLRKIRNVQFCILWWCALARFSEGNFGSHGDRKWDSATSNSVVDARGVAVVVYSRPVLGRV